MTTKTIQMYRTNLDGSETTLYPLTEAKYVTMDDGTTIEEALTNSDSSKYSPVIESSKAMFKVGEGDSVDLSESVIDGAYNSCVLKGKTMVNCIQEPSSQDVVLPYEFEDGQYVTINDTKESGALGVELKGQTLVNSVLFIDKTLPYTWVSNNISSRTCSLRGNFKTGTYALIVDFGEVLLGGVQSSQGVSCSIQVNYTNGTLDAYMRNGLENYSNKRLFTPFNINNEVSTIEFKGVSEQYENATTEGYIPPTVTVNKIMIIEYQEGMENWDIPYFTGMTSCKMPILTTIGKNLFDKSKVKYNTTIIAGNGQEEVNNLYMSSDFISVKPNENYISNNMGVIFFYNENRQYIGEKNNGTVPQKFTTPVNCKYIRVRCWTQYGEIEKQKEIVELEQIEQGSIVTSYEQHKSSILSYNEDIELRGIGDVRDTLDCLTGKMISNFDEIILTGDEEVSNWATSGAFFIKTSKSNQHQDNGRILCLSDKIPSSTINAIYRDTDGIGVMDGKFVIRITGLTTSEEVSNWLKQNAPIRVLYVTKEKSIKTVDFSIVDQNGNTIPTLKSWNTTTHIYSEIPENTLYPILSHSNPSYPVILKPSTKYSIVANSYSNNHTNSAINFNLGGATASTTVGSRVTTITTPSTLSNELLTMSGRGNKLNNVMVIEGDVAGDEPYFEGICDCKTPILSNVGKNLFNINGNINQTYDGWYAPHKNELIGENSILVNAYSYSNKGSGQIINVQPNTNYRVWYGQTGQCRVMISDSQGNHLGMQDLYGATEYTKIDFNSANNTSVVLHFTTLGDSSVSKPTIKNIFFSEYTANFVYEPYKSNILSIPAYYDEESDSDKTIVLRSLPNGVCDTLNVETGEYVQRIGEATLNGASGEVWAESYSGWSNKVFCVHNNSLPDIAYVDTSTINVVSDKLPARHIGDLCTGSKTGIASHSWSTYYCQVAIIGVNTLDQMKQWIQANPMTVQYQLKTPIVRKVDISGFPYAYKDGHVILSSGSVEQSLTPKVEYSLVANRNGQIETNTKQIRRHQDKLDDFEALMLTQMIQTHYEKTLLQFDFEMQMMALGGE